MPQGSELGLLELHLLEFGLLVLVDLFQNLVDLVCRGPHAGQAGIVIDEIDDHCSILAHISFLEPHSVLEFRGLVSEVGCDQLVKIALFIGLVKYVQSVCEQAKGRAEEDTLCVHVLLELSGSVQDGTAGGDHIVDNDRVLAVKVRAEELVGDDGILAVYDHRVISSFIEHTRVGTNDVGKIDRAVQCALIGGDDDDVVLVNDQIVHRVHQRLHELIRGCEVAEIHEGIDVLDSGVVGVKCDKVLDTQIAELFVHDRGVERLTAASLVLASLIQERHDDVNAARLAVDGRNDSFEILEMIVRGHMIGKTIHLIGNGMVCDIYKNIDIFSSCGLLQHSLAFARREAGERHRKSVIIFVISLVCGIVSVFVVVAHTEITDPLVDFHCEIIAGGKRNERKRRYRIAGLLKFVVHYVFCRHVFSFIGVVYYIVPAPKKHRIQVFSL